MKIIFALTTALFFSLVSIPGWAAPTKWTGFAKVSAERDLYVEHTKAAPGQPTVVLLNGLTYSTNQWTKFAAHLTQKGIGVVAFDFQGMGQTLLRYAPILAPIPFTEQVEDTRQLLAALKIPKPYNFVGLSYGGGIAAAYSHLHAEDIGHLILMAPFTKPIQGQDTWIKAQIWATRQMFPWNPASDEELYDFFLRQIIYATYPQAEPVVLENPFKLEAVFRLVQGIRQYNALKDVFSIPAKTLHLIVADNDQYIPREVMDEYWNAVPEVSRASRMVILRAEHKIPESVPAFSAAWVAEVLQNPDLKDGKTFEGSPKTGKAISGDFSLDLEGVN